MAKKKDIKIPDKSTMNLYQPDRTGNSIPGFIIGLILVGICTVLFSQFLVIGRLNKLAAKQAEVSRVQSQLTMMQDELMDYPKVKEDYIRYSDSYAEDAEKLVDRITLISLLENVTKDLGSVDSISVKSNSVTIKVITNNLDKLTSIKERLEESGMVRNVTVYSAQRSTGDTVSSVVFDAIAKEGE